MKTHAVASKAVKYIVYFTLTDKIDFRREMKETVVLFYKNRNEQAAKVIHNKYRGKGFRVKILKVENG